jgi:uncharacterized membrane protein
MDVSNDIVDVKLKDLLDTKTLIESTLNLTFDEDNIEILKNGLTKYKNTTVAKAKFIDRWEDTRNIYTIVLFVFFLFLYVFAFYGYLRRIPNLLLVVSIILLFSIPMIIFFEGLLASYFFVYSDLCDAVYGAMYQNEFPIYNKGLGVLISGFDGVNILLN